MPSVSSALPSPAAVLSEHVAVTVGNGTGKSICSRYKTVRPNHNVHNMFM